MTRLVPGPQISGVVYSKQTGAPLAGVTVTPSQALYTTPEFTTPVSTLVTDGEGGFAAYAQPGVYTFTISDSSGVIPEPVEVRSPDQGTSIPLLKSVADAAYVAKGPSPSGDMTGVTDYANILAAISALPASGGIITLKGDYYVNHYLALPNGVFLVSFAGAGYIASGAGISAATIHGVGAITSGVINQGATTSGGIIGVNIDGGDLVPAVNLTGSQRFTVKSAALDNSPGPVLQSDSTSLACYFVDLLVLNGLQTNPVAISGSVDIHGTDHFLQNIEGAPKQAALRSSSLFSAGVVLRGTNCMLANVIGETADCGIYVLGNTNRIYGSRGDTNYGADWIISGSNNKAIASSALNSGGSGTYDAVTVSGQGNTIDITVSQPGAGTYRYCYTDSTSWTAALSRNTFTPGCSGNGYATGIWNFTGSGLKTPAPFVPRVPVVPTVNSATPDVTGTSLLVTQNTSSTFITNFVNGTPNQKLSLYVTDSFTSIANNGTIKNNLGVSKVLKSGSTYHFEFINGVWVEDGIPPTTTITSGTLPTITPVSGTQFQVSTTRQAVLVAPVTLTPTSGAAATVQVALSPDNSTYTTVCIKTVPLGTALDSFIDLISLVVPAGWWVDLVAVNATLGTAHWY